MRKLLLASLLLVGVLPTSAKDQPYASVRSVQAEKYTTWTTTVGGYSSFANCSWSSNNLYCGESVSGPRVFYNVAELVEGDGWRFEVGCTAKWRWSKCAPIIPGLYSVRIKGTDMVFWGLHKGADYNKTMSMSFHILQAQPANIR